jgi:hypothetical protein
MDSKQDLRTSLRRKMETSLDFWRIFVTSLAKFENFSIARKKHYF